MAKVIVNLTAEEWNELWRTANREVRPVREQARYLIVRGLATEGPLVRLAPEAGRVLAWLAALDGRDAPDDTLSRMLIALGAERFPAGVPAALGAANEGADDARR